MKSECQYEELAYVWQGSFFDRRISPPMRKGETCKVGANDLMLPESLVNLDDKRAWG